MDAPGEMTPEPEPAPADNQGNGEGETQAAPDGPPSTEGEAAPAEPREDLADYPMPAGVPQELAARIDLLAPERPPYVQQEADRERWAVCARTGAAIALDQGDGLNDRELAQTAWHLARSLYRQRDELPTGEPDDVAPEAQAA